MSRTAEIKKKTREVQIELKINIDGTGAREISTGVGFLDHMLEIFSEFSMFDIFLKASGDTHIDEHHLTEEIGMSLGEAIREASGTDIERFADAKVPLDEALCEFVIDISGRPFFFIHNYNLIREAFYANIAHIFFDGLSRGGKFTIHVTVLKGINSHHIVEAIFKAGALCFRKATRERKLGKPSSTKGYID